MTLQPEANTGDNCSPKAGRMNNVLNTDFKAQRNHMADDEMTTYPVKRRGKLRVTRLSRVLHKKWHPFPYV